MDLDNVYKNYFQKSKLFLYPLLKIRQGASIVPIQTYIRWISSYELGECKLVCVYHNRDDKEFKDFEKRFLIGNELFFDYFLLPSKMVAYVFDFSNYAHDYRKICLGKYSELSSEFKFKILKFFNLNPHNHAYVDSYLYPEKYFGLYSDLLNCDMELLIKVGELCSPPDMNEETLLSKPIHLVITDNCLNLSKQ
jgi:hypothetical protein